MHKWVLLLLLSLLSFGALAAELKTITLSVDNMTCNMCPITVKKALRKLDGVSQVSAEYEGGGIGWATVTYDPARVAVDDLTFATEQAGYPARLKGTE